VFIQGTDELQAEGNFSDFIGVLQLFEVIMQNAMHTSV
jgi:hypothetical protein